MSSAPSRVPRPAPRRICLGTGELELQELPEPVSARNAAEAAPRSAPPPLPKRRASGPVRIVRRPEDPVLGTLFDALMDLDVQPDALAAARLCLDALAVASPCRTLIVHAFDVARRDFIVVHARGEHAESMVLSRHPTRDPLLRVAMPTGEPFAWPDLQKAPVNSLARFAEILRIRTILQAPVVSGPRWLGAFELVDPLHDAPFRTEDALAARYVANRYAAFLTQHGVIVDVGAIARFASAHFASSRG